MDEDSPPNSPNNSTLSSHTSPLSQSGRPEVPEKYYNKDGPASGPVKKVNGRPYSGYCDICRIRLNSYNQSVSHYEGKPHAKKLKQKDSEENTTKEESSDKKKKSKSSSKDEPPKKKSHSVPVTQLYCSACNLTFTSEAHAQDHYLGRNHDRVIHGLAPFFQGYYNTSTNKWQRTPLDPRVSTQLLSSEPPENMKGKTPHMDKPKIRGKYHCELCNLSLTCQTQLDSHMSGIKHTKAVRKKEGAKATVVQHKKVKCDVCCISLNSSSQYEDHLRSKKHKKSMAVNKHNSAGKTSSCTSIESSEPPKQPDVNFDPFDPSAEGNQ